MKQSVTPAENSTLTLTIASADIGKFRLSVTPFADPIPSEKDALTPALAYAFKTKNLLHPLIEAAFLIATTPDDKLPADYKKAREKMLSSHAGYAH
ncbi:MAG: hypothetical protein ACK5GK_06105, partial [Akkermansiaceae bacterium]